MSSLTQSNAWKALSAHYQQISSVHMRDLFAQDPKRFEKFSLRFGDILLDFSKNRITDETLRLLLDLARHANELREWYWKDRDLTVVHVPDYSYITPFLARLHYETYGRHSGQLWEDAARAYERVRPQVPAAQQVVRAVLLGAIGRLERDFRISDPDEVLELGIFLLTPKHQLELVFRGNKRKAKKPGRTFSAGPDTPTGLAGRVYASCQGVRVHTTDKLHNYHVPSSPKRETDYSGIVATPVIDWRSKGLPLGVAYLTTSTADGKVFQLLDQPSGGLYKQQADKPAIVPIDVTLSDLFRYLSDVALAVLSLFDH